MTPPFFVAPSRRGSSRRRPCHRKGSADVRRRLRLAAMIASALVVAGCGAAPHPTTTAARTTTTTQTRLAAPRPQAWLGLNYNSGSRIGDVTDFARYGIVYDRLGSFDIHAGATVGSSAQLAHGLRASIRAGMVPDVVLGPVQGPTGCSTNPNTSDLCLPRSPTDIGAYVRGFVRTVLSFRHADPRHRIIFEPMDEPWDWVAPPGTQSGIQAAQAYASVLRQLLPAAKAAGIPLSEIYVPAVGILYDRSYWIPDLYRAQPCLAPGPGTCGPIEGWNLHPYGPPTSSTAGISTVPSIRAAMRSGQDNIIISEMGFCATDVLGGLFCNENTPTVDGTSAQTAHWLGEALAVALPMHRAGWLRALIMWQRGGGGWSMQLPSGALTAQGRAFIRFARAHPPGG